MTEASRRGPSSRAMRYLNNRNNLAGLYLRKTLEQFDRERNYSMAHLDKDRFDMHDFLRHVQQCDNSPQDSPASTEYPTARPGAKIRETQTAPPGSRGGQVKVTGEPNANARRLAMMQEFMATSRRKKMTDFERAEHFLQRLRQKEEEEAINEQLEASGNFHHVLIRRIRAGEAATSRPHQSRSSHSRYPLSAHEPRGEVLPSGLDASTSKWALPVQREGEDGEGAAAAAGPVAAVARMSSRQSRSSTSCDAGKRRTSSTLQHLGSLKLADVTSHTDVSGDGMMKVVVNIPTAGGVRRRGKGLDMRVQEFCQKLEDMKRHHASSRLVAIMPWEPPRRAQTTSS